MDTLAYTAQACTDQALEWLASHPEVTQGISYSFAPGWYCEVWHAKKDSRLKATWSQEVTPGFLKLKPW